MGHPQHPWVLLPLCTLERATTILAAMPSPLCPPRQVLPLVPDGSGSSLAVLRALPKAGSRSYKDMQLAFDLTRLLMIGGGP